MNAALFGDAGNQLPLYTFREAQWKNPAATLVIFNLTYSEK
jgi:hypothetical protein